MQDMLIIYDDLLDTENISMYPKRAKNQRKTYFKSLYETPVRLCRVVNH